MVVTMQVENGGHLCCLGFVDLGEILGTSALDPRQEACMEKLLEVAWVAWARALGNHQNGANSVSLVNWELRGLCLLAGWGGGGAQQRSNGLGSFLYVPGAFQMLPLYWSPEWMNLWGQICVQPFHCCAWVSSSPPSYSDATPLVFTATCYGNSSFWHWCPRLGSLMGTGTLRSSGGTSAAEIFLLILNRHI